MTGTIKKINKTKFGMLLAETLPAIIETEAENKRALENVEWLMKKSEGNLSPEETSLFSLLVRLIEDVLNLLKFSGLMILLFGAGKNTERY